MHYLINRMRDESFRQHTMRESLAFISTMRCCIRSTLDKLLNSYSDIAFVDFPAHANVGDSAIWRGTYEYLFNVSHKNIAATYALGWDISPVVEKDTQIAILLNGGGNFGDLYPRHQQRREEFIKRFRFHRVIQLPQSIEFTCSKSLDRAKRIIGQNKRFIFMVRDQRSCDFAVNNFECEVILCPDMAFWCSMQACGSTDRPPQIGCIFRDDKEAKHKASPFRLKACDYAGTAWIKAGVLERFLYYLINNDIIGVKLFRSGSLLRIANSFAMKRGRGVLDQVDLMLTDRLHVHILATMYGIPNILFDNSYQKNSSFFETWTKDCRICQFAHGDVDLEKAFEKLSSPSFG